MATTPAAVRPEPDVVCGVDLGGTNCRILVADTGGVPLVVAHHPTPGGTTPARLAGWLADQVGAAVGDAGGILRAAGIGVPGPVARTGTAVLGAQNLPPILGTAFLTELAARLHTPVRVANDAALALRGEREFGQLAGVDTGALISLGTGVGCAVSVDGVRLTGRTGLVGEFGRLYLPGRDVRLRDLLSGAGLAAHARAAGHPVRSARDLFAAPDTYRTLLAEVDAALRFVVCLVALAYEPGAIVLTGGLSDAFDTDTVDGLSERVRSDVGVDASVRRSSLGGTAGLLGAASLARSLLTDPAPGARPGAVLYHLRSCLPEPVRKEAPCDTASG